MDYHEGLKKLNELSEYSQLQNDELGELCELLEAIWYRTPYGISEGFQDAIAKEILAQLDNFKTYSRIVETIETKEIKQTIRELEWD